MAVQPEASAVSGASAPLAGRCIWVVDDEAAVRLALRERLCAWGALVHDFADPQAVQQALQRTPALPAPHLLLTDMRMPGGDGVAMAALLRNRQPGLPVLVVTGNTAPHDLQTLRDSGLPTVHKPFRAEVLLLEILSLLAAASAGPDAPP